MELLEIYKPIEKKLEKVEARLRTVLTNNEKIVSTVSKYLLRTRGKRLRPALVLFASELGGAQSSRVIDLAASIELIHSATLVHDDVIDKAAIRRKRPSLNQRFSNETAILFGDYLYSKAFGIISALDIPRITTLLLRTTNTICQGEMRQLRRIFQPVREKEYLKIIADKTASLFSVCCETGGVVVGADVEQIAELKKYGYNLGMSFQIVDDCLDLVGDEKKIGKTAELDTKGGKMTLPHIYLNKYPNKTRAEAVNYALGVAKRYEKKALTAIAGFKGNKIKKALNNLVGYVMSRVN